MNPGEVPRECSAPMRGFLLSVPQLSRFVTVYPDFKVLNRIILSRFLFYYIYVLDRGIDSQMVEHLGDSLKRVGLHLGDRWVHGCPPRNIHLLMNINLGAPITGCILDEYPACGLYVSAGDKSRQRRITKAKEQTFFDSLVIQRLFKQARAAR